MTLTRRSFFASATAAIPALAQNADAAGARRDHILWSVLEKPYPPEGAWRYENFALAAYYLNQRVGEANQAILTEREKEFPAMLKNKNFHWHAYILERLYFLFHDNQRMNAAASNAILDMLWQWAGPSCRLSMTLPERDWWMWGSENHHVQAWSGFWGAAVLFNRHPEYRNRKYGDGSTPLQMAPAFAAYFRRFAAERAAKGLLVECNSEYNKYTLGGLYNLADFAIEPILRKRVRMLLDLYWTDWAIEQIDGVRGGSRQRSYPGRSSTLESPGSALAWFHFGLGKMNKNPSVVSSATTSYRPSPIVARLALDPKGRGVYQYVSRRPALITSLKKANFVDDPANPFYAPTGVYTLDPDAGGLARYTWCTPDFVMGASMVPARDRKVWAAIASQNRWEGVIFAGDPVARIFAQPLPPERGSVYNANWSVENKGVLIVQRLKSTNAHGQRVWFSESLKRAAKGGWIFAEAPRAFAAVRVVAGKTTWEAGDKGIWLRCADEFSPVILEVARRSDFPGFAAFQSAILANPLAWGKGRLDYKSSFYKTALTLFADYSQAPQVDGKPVNYRPKKVYDSPFLDSDYGSGVVTIRKGQEKLVLDFIKSK
jgi:hypothetical protein